MYCCATGKFGGWGHEGEGLLTEADRDLAYDRRHAVDFIIDTVMKNPKEITLIGIGPFTNFAIALAREPRIAIMSSRLSLWAAVPVWGATPLSWSTPTTT